MGGNVRTINRGAIASGLVALAALGLSLKTAVDDDDASGDAPADVTSTSDSGTPESSSPVSALDSQATPLVDAGEAGLCAQVDELLSDGFPGVAAEVIAEWHSTTTISTTTTTTSTVPPTPPSPAPEESAEPADPEATGGAADSSVPADNTGTTTSTTAAPTPVPPPVKPCTETALEKVAAADALAGPLCEQLEEPLPDTTSPDYEVALDARFSLFQRLAKVDRQRAPGCATPLADALREAADTAAAAGNFARREELWKQARTINPKLDEDGPPPPTPDDPEAISQYLNETWARHKGDATALGIALAALAVGFAVAVRIGRAWVVRRGGHSLSSKYHRWLACVVLAGVAAAEVLFVIALRSHTTWWLALVGAAVGLTILAAIQLAKSNVSLFFTTDKPKEPNAESAEGGAAEEGAATDAKTTATKKPGGKAS